GALYFHSHQNGRIIESQGSDSGWRQILYGDSGSQSDDRRVRRLAFAKGEKSEMADTMKIRAQLQGDVADVKVLMFHPMETGLRKDPISGEIIPLHFIQRVIAALNGKTVMDAQWSRAVSKNPFVNFRIRGARAGDKVSVSWEDNMGAQASIETMLS